MKILHILSYLPVPPHFGGALRMYHLLQHTTRHHDVTVVAYGPKEKEHELRRAFGPGLQRVVLVPRPWPRVYRRLGQFYSIWTKHSYFYYIGYSNAMQNAIEECCAKEHFDIIQTEFSMMGSFNLPSSAAKVLDAHNVEFDNFRRMALNGHTRLRSFFYRQEFTKFFFEELEACRRHDALFVTSERDKSLFDEHLPSVRKFVIPNGVDAIYFHPSVIQPRPWSMVFTGMMGYVPNYDGILYFLDVVFPLILKKEPRATLTVVGNKPPRALLDRVSPNVTITGLVDDVRPFVWNSSVYVVPLRMGSGTRLKVLEALSMKKPIVTTSIGCEGIDVQHGQTAMIVDEPEAFAEAVLELFQNASLRQKLTENGLELVRNRYQWPVINQRVEEAYSILCSSLRVPLQAKQEEHHETL